jgi:VWFA-related protein
MSSNGEPVTGLTGTDFKLTVNGQTRPVHTVQFISSRAVTPPVETPRLANVSSNEAPSTGRLLLFVIDENYLRIGAARAVLRTAERVMNALAPGDLVGLTRLPTGRGGVDFTTNRERVRTALSGVLGAQPTRTTDRVRLSEAHAFDTGDRNTWEQVVTRECGGGFQDPGTDGGASRVVCVTEIEATAKSLLVDARMRSRVSITAFEQLTQRLATLNMPVNVIVISEGLYLGRDGTSDLSHFSRLAATARVTFHVVQPDQSMFDFDGPRTVGSTFSESFLAEGLEQIAGMTRGSYFKVAAAGDGAFDRIARELSGYYLLSFEPTDADRASRDRRIKVDVDRRGLTVKARSTYALANASDGKDVASLSPEEQIKNLLSAPLPTAGLPIRVATYSVTSPEANRVRVVIGAEIGDPGSNSVEWPVGVLVLNADNKIFVDSTRYMTLEPVTRLAASRRMLTMTMVLEPGEYSLRLAAMDHDGKSGSVHHAMDARLRRVGGDAVRASDLMISADVVDGGVPRPVPTAVHHSETMYSILELSGDMGRVGKSRVTVQVADSESAPALVSVDAQPVRGTQSGQRSFAAVLKLGILPPGEYVARAVVKVPGQPDAIVARPFRLDPIAPAADAPVAAAPRSVDDAPAPLPAAKVAAPVAKFAVEDVMKPAVVRPFIEYLRREHPVSEEHAAVVERALAGSFENLPVESKSAGSDDVTLAFIRGLAQLQKRQYQQAAAWFQVALKGASDFLGAAVYLGAVHAAAGRDIDAIGAWQMATIGDNSDAVYPMLVDALLRVGDAQGALDTIADAPDAWPSDDERLMRTATAQAMLGQFAPALASLTGLLQRHPDDQSLLMVAIQVLYRQHTAKPLSPEDRARFDGYSKRYLDAKGAEAALVQTWRRFVLR